MHLADHLAAVRVQSERFTKIRGVVLETIPRYFRGEYGAKLALSEPVTGRAVLGYHGQEEAVRRYLEERGTLSVEGEKALLGQIHPYRRQPTLLCHDCHSSQGALVDLATVGYPRERIEALKGTLITQMIDNIRAGKPFHILGSLRSSF